MLAQIADVVEGHEETAGAMLQRVIAALEAAGIQTCILHGYQNLPEAVSSDVDCVVSTKPDLAVRHLELHGNRIGVRIVLRDGSYVVLASSGADGVPVMLRLDLMQDCVADDLVLCAGNEVLATRRRFGSFWVPAAGLAFALYLNRSIYKRRFSPTRVKQIEDLYKEDPSAAQSASTLFWKPGTSKHLAWAAGRGQWDRIAASGKLRRELIVSCLRRAPAKFLLGRLRSTARRIFRLVRPTGVAVVLLGPDGAGKSSAIEALGNILTDAFARHEVRGFAPSLSRLWKGKPRSTAQPHGLPLRSWPLSLLRAGYWVAYNLWSHVSLRWARARTTLVLYDRHFIDILIDPRRYRYGGPQWALRLNTWLMPRPDLVLLLDAPAEVLQARKQEVPFAETARQRALYRAFVSDLRNGHIIDASRSRENVATRTASIVLDCQANRCRR